MARPRHPGKTGRTAISVAERTKAVMDLRRAGATLDTIAAQLNISKSTAHRAVERGLEQMLREPTEAVRQMEADRLDALQLANWRTAMGAAERREDGTTVRPTVDERLAAGRYVLQVMERRAKLLGLDQPQELRIALEQGQVDFMETTLRAVVEGFFAALASAGYEKAAADVHDVVYGQVIPRALDAAAGGPPLVGAT